MKRAILIATGAVGGLGAVLAITPPQFTSTQSTSLAMPEMAGTAVAPSAQASTSAAAPAQTTKSVSGTFAGDVVNVKYGNVQVKITVENGKIIEAQAIQAPSGKNDRWTQKAVPVLRQQTLAAQSANISGASGASYTSYGWYTSLVSALAKAGM